MTAFLFIIPLQKSSLIAMSSVSNFCDRHLRIIALAFTLLFTSNCSFCSWNNSEDMIFEQCRLKGHRQFLLMSMLWPLVLKRKSWPFRPSLKPIWTDCFQGKQEEDNSEKQGISKLTRTWFYFSSFILYIRKLKCTRISNLLKAHILCEVQYRKYYN